MNKEEINFNDLSKKTQLQIWENNELLNWLNYKSTQNNNLQSQLTKSNNKIEKIKEYCKNINNDCKNDFTYAGMAVANNILSIIDGSDE